PPPWLRSPTPRMTEMAAATLVMPYRGLFQCHVADERLVAEPNQVLLLNAHVPVRFSPPRRVGMPASI
ncbi:MAG: hypothetical protein JHC88_14870, partial [Niveispirillum sp.]|nr:hypothetical protein [Niveispirillum sp.]